MNELKLVPSHEIPEVQEQEKLLNDLQHQLSAVERNINHDLDTMALSTRDSRALAVLDRRPIPTSAESPRLPDLRERRQAVQDAIEMQRKRLAATYSQASIRVAREHAPRHKAAVEKVLRAAVDLSRAMMAEEDIRKGLMYAGYSTDAVMRPFGVPVLGRLDEYESGICHMLREAVEHGYLDRRSDLVKAGQVLMGGEAWLPEIQARRAKEEAARQAEEDKERRRREKINSGNGGFLGALRKLGVDV